MPKKTKLYNDKVRKITKADNTIMRFNRFFLILFLHKSNQVFTIKDFIHGYWEVYIKTPRHTSQYSNLLGG